MDDHRLDTFQLLAVASLNPYKRSIQGRATEIVERDFWIWICRSTVMERKEDSIGASEMRKELQNCMKAVNGLY